jgi:glycosyltransferase involved in cell wall biosynthesis
MHKGPIYSLRFDENKTLKDYFRGLEKALFSKSRILQIEWKIFNNVDISEVLARAEQENLSVAIKCSPGDIVAIRKLQAEPYIVHCFFHELYELELNLVALNSLGAEHSLILQGKRHSKYQAMVEILARTCPAKLHFEFAPYDPTDPTSMTVRDIAKILRNLRRQNPGVEISTLNGHEPFDPSIHPRIELEAFLKNPQFGTTSIGDEAEKPKFSFIIPTYNSKIFLLNVIKHLLTQTASAATFEILIIDDGSTDGSCSFIQDYLRSERVKTHLKYFYWSKPSENVEQAKTFRAGQARNLGANHARGNFLIFLDADILVPSNFLEDLDEKFKENDVVQYVRHHITPQKSDVSVSFQSINSTTDVYIEEHNYWNPFFKTKDWMGMHNYWKYTCTYCLAVRTQDFFEVGRFRRLFVSYGFEDTDLGYRLHKKGLRFALSPLVTLHLTPPKPRFGMKKANLNRFFALSKTAKTFYLLNLDDEIYIHFGNYLGGETQFLRWLSQPFGKFRSKKSHDLKNLSS